MTPPRARETAMVKGFIILALSVLFNGASVHLVRLALKSTTPAMATVISGSAAVLAFLVAGWVWRRAGWRWAAVETVTPAGMWGCLRRNPVSVLFAPIVGGIAALLVNQTIRGYGAETAAFLSSLMLVFLVFGGLLQGDRLTLREIPAIALIVVGAFLYSYQGGTLVYAALGMMAVAMLCAATKQLLIRRVAERESLPPLMAVNLALVVVVCLFALAPLTGQLRMPDARAVAFGAMSGVMCSFIGMTFLYVGYGIVGVARGGPLNAMRPLVVLAIGLALGIPLPNTVRLIGGGVILVASAALPVLHHFKTRSERRKLAASPFQ